MGSDTSRTSDWVLRKEHEAPMHGPIVVRLMTNRDRDHVSLQYYCSTNNPVEIYLCVKAPWKRQTITNVYISTLKRLCPARRVEQVNDGV